MDGSRQGGWANWRGEKRTGWALVDVACPERQLACACLPACTLGRRLWLVVRGPAAVVRVYRALHVLVQASVGCADDEARLSRRGPLGRRQAGRPGAHTGPRTHAHLGGPLAPPLSPSPHAQMGLTRRSLSLSLTKSQLRTADTHAALTMLRRAQAAWLHERCCLVSPPHPPLFGARALPLYFFWSLL